ncbi:hypothetical protein DL769_008805 [Monosporascus sp. CRB-8-3]|nr:hypothetical protein DL769_008805 [Monosporascus sp. CRB-8-3]
MLIILYFSSTKGTLIDIDVTDNRPDQSSTHFKTIHLDTGSMSTKKAILITGATGKQGGATIDALLDAGATSAYDLLAVTRSPESPSAKKLESRGVKIVKGDLNDISGLFANAKRAIGGVDPKIWGVLGVQVFMGKGASVHTEESQGKALVDGALANGVEFFVYASVDRGGLKSYDNELPEVPHFRSKYNIEHHLVDQSKDRMSWTILRPVFFMDNIVPGSATKLTATMWKAGLKEKPLQLIAIKDIGWFAAQAFLNPDKYSGRGLSLAGDSLTFAEANATFSRKVGHEIPTTFGPVGKAVMKLVPEFGGMFRWFYASGYDADIQALKREHPGLLSWSDWVEQEAKHLWASK